SILSNTQEASTINIRIQVTMDSDYLNQIDILKISLSNLVINYSKQLQTIQAKNNRISELEHECEYFKKQIAKLNTKLENLNLYQNQVEILKIEKSKLEYKNVYLNKQRDEQYNTQQK
ncbi:16413_t:CDS:1, partial [Dentiscutata heterogama]